MSDEEKDFYERMFDLLYEAHQELSEVLQHMEYMQSKMNAVSTNLSIKMLNAAVFEKDSK